MESEKKERRDDLDLWMFGNYTAIKRLRKLMPGL